jgi:hypothetical protein
VVVAGQAGWQDAPFAAVDVCYLPDGSARAASVLAVDAAFSHPHARLVRRGGSARPLFVTAVITAYSRTGNRG